MHLMKEYYPQFVLKPRPIYHQWLSEYLAKDIYMMMKKYYKQLLIIQQLLLEMSKLDMYLLWIN